MGARFNPFTNDSYKPSFVKGLNRAPMLSYTHEIIPLERVTTREKTEGIYHPINFFQRYSEVTLVNTLVNISPNFYSVSILQILITHFTISSQNHMVLASYWLLWGATSGGKVFANIVSPIGSPTVFPRDLIIYITGKTISSIVN